MAMMATLILADAAQAIGNKLYILGGGWSITTGNVPTAIALAIKVPWDQANERHTLRLELLDSDGEYVTFPGPDGLQELIIEQEFEVGRPAGIMRGTPIDLAMAINLGPLPFPPDGRFEWRLTINDHAEPHWHAAFSTVERPLGA